MSFNNYDMSGLGGMGSSLGTLNFNPNTGYGVTSGLGGLDASSLFGNTSGLGYAGTTATPANLMSLGLDTSGGNWFGNISNSIANNQSNWTAGLGALKGLADTWSTFQTNKNQKEQLQLQTQLQKENLAMLKKTFNRDLTDQQTRRVSANPNAESVESYVNKWGA